MKKFNWKKIVTPIAMLVIGLLGGLLGAFILLTVAGVSFTNTTDTGIKTAKTVYSNTTDTTKAVKKVQNAVVSVINYQEGSSSDSLNDLYGRIFGGGDRSDSSQENSKDSDGLQVAGEGSGVIYKKDGKEAYIVTNNHVVDGAKKLEIMLSDGSKITGKLVGKDTYSDLAVVKVSSDKIKTVAEFADSNSLTVGEKAIAIGSPLGTEYANSVTEGIVSSLSRTVTMQNDNGETVSTNAIQTDAAINPGNSGGALVNIEGQVIGINSSKISSTSAVAGSAVEGMGFAIPSNDVVEIINQLEKNGKVTRPALGISMADLNSLSSSTTSKLDLPDEVKSGVVVGSVQKGMPADGKLQENDVITEIDGKEISSKTDIQTNLYSHSIGDNIKVTFYRGKDKKTEDLKLTKSTEDLSD
ncbi:trypsin-like peptidase domain-containing protein [Streptococcus vestibularis]|uniref:S1C family serine protease n=1 Tax=Streptococcus vestibularis TaxID=1343 RepID=UPI00232E5ABD|nr:trypsin-like peptidase domain-containing protein [Streptococcus vestibularis]MDB6184719.1 trypsin-like peptidase domain-containing protein [Streptococcus vestibularis]MDB6201612.1 trypsin-like peptidase domain-containing protein [Streptococcus vestibularis]MDB6207811.1 trypsin-like peptidase domain-containing protein [Streptococcus vestibularis]MDB6211594.1 trypsin-like peptidase domain-containing protein [Streptococcus vestibularis]MDB6215707.1 trypsin-like peptidase domain-containing prot